MPRSLSRRRPRSIIAGDDAARMQRLLDALESIDDVQDVYTTAVMETA
jgi:transcriptional/translational regulatory protein YebC/TACO1